MTKDDIIRMAREAIVGYPGYDPENSPPLEGDELAVFERFAALVAAASASVEREALEKIDWTVLLRQGGLVTWGDAATLADRVISAIRARGETTSRGQA